MTPATPGFHHVTLVTSNAAQTIGFYRDLLGLSLLHQTRNADDPDTEQLFFGPDAHARGSLITFLEWPEMRRGRWGVGGIHHVALGTSDEKTQLQWKRWLRDRGVAVSGPYDRGWFHSIYFVDPDGQVLEIATAGPGYGMDEPI